MIPMVRPISSLTRLTGSFFWSDLTVSSQRCTSSRNSLSNSAARLSSATVRTMMPKPWGFIESSNCLSRERSASRLIFWLTITPSANGMSTMLRPAMLISAVRRGPLVLMGSLVTCTRIGSPTFSTSAICPSLPTSGSRLILSVAGTFLLSDTAFVTYERNVRNCAPRSK